ncbi:MAG: hypothetical protein MZV64_42455 [Ignavibacteriales bacterium]|nr:hypothetical protein [Ignavibacteriales bacterium]
MPVADEQGPAADRRPGVLRRLPLGPAARERPALPVARPLDAATARASSRSRSSTCSKDSVASRRRLPGRATCSRPWTARRSRTARRSTALMSEKRWADAAVFTVSRGGAAGDGDGGLPPPDSARPGRDWGARSPCRKSPRLRFRRCRPACPSFRCAARWSFRSRSSRSPSTGPSRSIP